MCIWVFLGLLCVLVFGYIKIGVQKIYKRPTLAGLVPICSRSTLVGLTPKYPTLVASTPRCAGDEPLSDLDIHRIARSKQRAAGGLWYVNTDCHTPFGSRPACPPQAGRVWLWVALMYDEVRFRFWRVGLGVTRAGRWELQKGCPVSSPRL